MYWPLLSSFSSDTMFDDDMISFILREVNGRLPRGRSISRENHFHFSRETVTILARITSISREKRMMFSREMLLDLARNASCPRRACKIGTPSIFLASKPSAPFQSAAPQLQTQNQIARLRHTTSVQPHNSRQISSQNAAKSRQK